MRARWKRGRGPSKGWRALEALAKACAGLFLIVVLTHALSGAGINPTDPTHALATVLFVAFAWIGIKSARAARRIERDARPHRTARPAQSASDPALPPPAPERAAKRLTEARDPAPAPGRRLARLLKSLFHVK